MSHKATAASAAAAVLVVLVVTTEGAAAARAATGGSPGAGAQAAAPPVPAAATHSWQLLLLAGDWQSLRLGQEVSVAFPVLRKAARRPLLVLEPRDVESYVWSVQRVTLRPEATRRLLAAHPAVDFDVWSIHHFAFAVRVDGELLYGGVFDDPESQMTMRFPVIHGELVDGRAVLYLLPRQMSWGFDARFEETVGSGDGARVAFLAETGPLGDARDEEEPDPVRDRFRPLLRDARIHAVFAALGTLVEAPLPPPPLAALAAADRVVDAARAARQPKRLARFLAEDYHLFFPFGYRVGLRERLPLDRNEALSLFGDGWRPGRYAVLATEPRVSGDEGIVYTLLFVRGEIDGAEVAKAILARRRYRRAGDGWLLVNEVHRLCFDDSPGWRLMEKDPLYLVTLDGPCWPPPTDENEPPLSAPTLGVH